MLGGRYQRGIDYLLAVCVTALVLLGREAVAGLLGRSDPFLPFIGAVLIASWQGGLRPGLLATLLSAVATDFFFVPPVFSLQIAKFVHGGDLLLFIVLGVLISSLSEKRLRLVRQLRDADRTQGRIPGYAGPRAAEPAGADRQLDRVSPAQSDARSEACRSWATSSSGRWIK